MTEDGDGIKKEFSNESYMDEYGIQSYKRELDNSEVKHSAGNKFKQDPESKKLGTGKKPHGCYICGKKFAKPFNLKQHMTLVHSGNHKIECDICFCEYDSLDALKDHKMVHQDDKLKKCMYCKYTNPSWNLLKFHLDRKHPQHGEKKYPCDRCGKCFTFDETRTLHIRKIHSQPEDNTQKVCYVCGFSTLNQASLNKHILWKHEKDKHKQCPHCSYRGVAQKEIEVHIDGKHPELYDKRFHCNHCTKSFIFERSLKKHLDKLQVTKKLACGLCGLKIMKITELYDHVSAIHPERIQNPNEPITPLATTGAKMVETCEFCNSEWENLDKLKAHKMQVHTEGKMQLCFYCGYKNANLFNLRNHIERNHPEHGEKKHLCDFCGEGFMFLQSVKKHKIENHRKQTCHICGKECFNIRSLHVHIDSKHPEHDKKNFSCDHCSRRFIFKDSLKTHLENIRTGPKRKNKPKHAGDKTRQKQPTGGQDGRSGGHDNGRGLPPPPPAHVNEDSSQGAYMLPTQVPYQSFLGKKLPFPPNLHRY